MKRIVLWISLLVCILSLGALSNSVSANPDTLTVTVQVPEEWNNVHLFAWKEDFDILSAWPGTPMSEGSDGRYTLEIPSGYPYVIVNNGEGGAQTQDMETDGISNIWVVISDYYGEVFYFDPGIIKIDDSPDSLNSMALVGEGDDELNWDPADPMCDMTKVKDGVFTKDITLYKGTTIMFKLCGNDAWDSGYNLGGYDVIYMDTNSPAELAEGNDSMDLCYTATRDCILTVKLNMNGNAPTVTLTETSTALPPLPGTTYVKLYVSIPEGITPNIWAWGDNGDAFSQWPGEPMVKNGDWWEIEIPDDCHSAIVNDGAVQTYDLDIAMGAKNWIVVNDDWSATVYNYEPDPTTYIDVYVRMANGITPYLWAYDSVGGQIVYEAWPGSPMTWDGEWWYLQVPSWADCLLVNDGSEEYLTTQNLYLSDCEQVWIDVDEDWYGTVYDTEPPEIVTYTVYIRVPKSWGEPYVDSGDECYTLTSDGQWWCVDLPVDVDKFLITNGYSESPSVSLSIEDAVWIDVMDNGLVHVAYENPGDREDLEPEKPKIPPAKRIKRSTDNTSEESSSGWIILLIAGILVVAAAATVIIVIVVKRKKKQNVVSGDASPTNTLNYMEEK